MTPRLRGAERAWIEEAKGPITNWEEFHRYPWPEVTDASFRSLEFMSRHLPDGMKIITSIPGGPLEQLTFLMGFETFSYALLDQPDLVAAIAQRVDEILCSVVRVTTGLDSVGAQWLNDDLGFKGGTLAAPDTLRTHVFPTQKKICESPTVTASRFSCIPAAGSTRSWRSSLTMWGLMRSIPSKTSSCRSGK